MKWFNELSDPSHASNYLSKRLNHGELVLFLGAGTSAAFGLPGWIELINKIRFDLQLPAMPENCGAEDLQVGADECERKFADKSKFRELVRSKLYQDLPSTLDIDVFGNHLLLALSAMLMGSSRGHVNRVISLNYDSMLQWFLSIYGIKVRTIYKLPALEGAEDVRIYHPHGYLPHPDVSNKVSDFLILGLDSVDTRLGSVGDDLWPQAVRNILMTGVCLFLGMSQKSARDRALSPIFSNVSKATSDRPLGIWAVLEKKDAAKAIDFQRNNIIPLYFTEKKQVTDFVFKICQTALKNQLPNEFQ